MNVNLGALRLSQLRTELDKGLKELDSGDFKLHDKTSLTEAFEESKSRGRKKLSSKKVRTK